SAMGHETDRLEDLAAQVSPHPQRRELDMLLSAGERITMALVSMILNDLHIPAISFTGSQSGIITDTHHSKARIVTIHATRIETELALGKVVVVAGFQGVSQEKEVTTLGRGGSDTTAVALAAALHAVRCEIYTDVAGVYAVDPRIRPDSRKIERISYDEMIELAGAGCHILEPRSVIFAKKFNIPVWVGSSFAEDSGTIITHSSGDQTGPILGIALNEKEAIISLIGLTGKASHTQRILRELADNNVPVEILFQRYSSEGSIDFSIAIPETECQQAREIIDKIARDGMTREIVRWDSLARISIIGKGMKGIPGIAVKFVGALKNGKIPVFIISTADSRISAFVPRKMCHQAVNTVADVFQLP
ncbi:aspartate kinase, partial [candidate division CSSED10-310 bacterium]